MMEECINIAEEEELTEELIKIGEEEKKKEEQRRKEKEMNRLDIINQEDLEKKLTNELVAKLQASSIPPEDVISVLNILEVIQALNRLFLEIFRKERNLQSRNYRKCFKGMLLC